MSEVSGKAMAILLDENTGVSALIKRAYREGFTSGAAHVAKHGDLAYPRQTIDTAWRLSAVKSTADILADALGED